jgi:hypothetical protein
LTALPLELVHREVFFRLPRQNQCVITPLAVI